MRVGGGVTVGIKGITLDATFSVSQNSFINPKVENNLNCLKVLIQMQNLTSPNFINCVLRTTTFSKMEGLETKIFSLSHDWSSK